jgi:hypothetical protein
LRRGLGILILLASASAASAQSAQHFIIPGGSIGVAQLEGADQGALTRELGEPSGTERRGDHDYYRYGPSDGPVELMVDFDLVKDEPFEIWTGSPIYRTREGLGVGSTEQAIRAASGKLVCEGHDAQGDGLLVYNAIWFLLRDGHAVRVSIRKHLSASDFQTGPVHC